MGMTCNLLRVSAAELEAYKQDSNLLVERIKAASTDAAHYDIDQSWDGIVFLLTGKNSSDGSHSLSRIIFSGQYIDKEQKLDYGPANYLSPDEVATLNETIANTKLSDLKPRFDAALMKEEGVYPNAWEHEDALDYLLEYFETIQEIYALATKHKEAIITYISH